MASPRVVIAAPLFRAGEHLEEALQSLLAQTERDFALVLVDDCSGDDTVARARDLTAGDDRVEIHVNAERLGLLRNTNRAYLLARERFPNAEYFALGSDHDVWEPRWLERMLSALKANPHAVLAYPENARVAADGRRLREPWRFDTRGVASPAKRLRRVAAGMAAGDMVYGLFSADALRAVGRPYRSVLYPDRLLLAELALRGEFVQVPEILWTRRLLALPGRRRQRRAFWPSDVPLRAHLPYSLVHAGVLCREHGARTALLDFLPRSLAFEFLTTALALAYAGYLRARAPARTAGRVRFRA